MTATNPNPSAPISLPVGEVALLTDGRDWSVESHLLLDLTPDANAKKIGEVIKTMKLPEDEWAFELAITADVDDDVIRADLYTGAHAFRTGKRADTRRLELAPDDTGPEAEAEDEVVLCVIVGDKARIVTVSRFEEQTGSPRVAVVEANLPGSTVADARYMRVAFQGSHDVRLLPSVVTTEVDAALKPLLGSSIFGFPPGVRPRDQPSLRVLPADDRVVLAHPWTRAPTTETVEVVILQVAFDRLQRFDPPRPRNPELSWEYWDGTGWWQIEGLEDRTGNLVSSGRVVFDVPTNLAPTDVGGRNNHWIRARLVGGDYGREEVTTKTVIEGPDPDAPPPAGATEPAAQTQTHTVVVSTDNIRAPYVVELSARYEVCDPVAPEVVLAEDSGGYRDQTEANRTAEAVVEFFTPLGTTLASLTVPEPPAPSSPSAALPPECVVCATGAEWEREDESLAPASAGGGGRGLCLCFDAEIDGGPINLLFLVDEADHDEAFPLRVEALIDDDFEEIPAVDGTRGLGESGILSFVLDRPPQRRVLFGHEGHWVRVRPNRVFDSSKWLPRVRGIYVNAVGATAAETQELELLGSSDGRPNLTVMLARTPVLAEPPERRTREGRDDGVELRIRERLGEEEIDVLLGADPESVRQDVGGRPGAWVRWRQVADVNDAGPGDRVYALEEATGRISFGDGLHGRIPPIGRDAILAVRYRRGGGAAANAVKAWSAMNLITPVPGVDAAVVPVGAAGGSDPQDAASTLRFATANLVLQGRALALRDFEALALQFSPVIAQARAFAAPAGMRVVIVTRGDDPRPPKAVQRALQRHLVAHASPVMGAKDALTVAAPTLVPLRLLVDLVVDAIEHTGTVSGEARTRIRELLDPASGGLDRAGWRLGELPSDEDIAVRLAGIDGLEGIAAITVETDFDGAGFAVPRRSLRAAEARAARPQRRPLPLSARERGGRRMNDLRLQLADVDFAQLTELGRSLIPTVAPRWTDHNVHDPGIMLIELLAWIAEAQIYSLARLRRDERYAYARLLGVRPQGPRPARGYVWPMPPGGDGAPPWKPGRIIAPTEAVVPNRPDAPVFHATHPIRLLSAVMTGVYTIFADGSVRDWKLVNAKDGATFRPFGGAPAPGDRLVLELDDRFGDDFTPGDALVALGVEVVNDRPSPDADGVTMGGPRLRIAIEDASGERPIRLVQDTTVGLSRSGVLLLACDARARPAGQRFALTIQSASGGFLLAPRLKRIAPNVLPVQQVEDAVDERESFGTGDPDQSYRLERASLVDPGTLALRLYEGGAWRDWRATSALDGCGPADRAFVLDADTGTLRFGNGVNGARPPAGAALQVAYRISAGVGGNLPPAVPWGVPGILGTFGVNGLAMTGGTLGLSLDEIQRLVRRRTRDRRPCVATEDLVRRALALTDLGVARAHEVTAPDGARGVRTLVVVGPHERDEAPTDVVESPEWLAEIRRRLAPDVPLGQRLTVVRPRYVTIRVLAKLRAEPLVDPARVRQDVEDALRARLAIVGGGAWPFGRKLGPVTVKGWLRAVPGVARVDEMRLVANGRESAAGEPLELGRAGLPRLALESGDIRVEAAPAGGAR